MEYGGSPYEVINLGSGRPMSLLEVVKALEEVLGIKAQLEFLPPQPGDAPKTWASLEKAERLLGFTPSVSFREGLEGFSQWLRGRRCG